MLLVEDATTLALTLSRFEEDLQALARDIMADANQRVAAALTVAVTTALSECARVHPDDDRVCAATSRSLLPGVDLGPPVVRLKNVRLTNAGGHPTLEPELVATGWRWCNGAGTRNRHMWNKYTKALALFPKPNRRKQMSLLVERCEWHAPTTSKVADIVAKAKARMKVTRLP